MLYVVATVAAAALLLAPPSPAKALHKSPAAAGADPADDFHTLAQQRPWTCAEPGSAPPIPTGWSGGAAQCAWQNRLRMRQWTGPGGAASGQCLSAQAHWWAWARRDVPAAPAAWRTQWTSQSLADERGQEKRIVIIHRLANEAWSVTEWRWNPSPRVDTRRWQEGRWKLLAARAAQRHVPAQAAQGPREARMLRSVLEANLKQRPSDVGPDTWRWQAAGMCLNVDAIGLGQQIMQLPYASVDSRMEQRAAMQLQLARRYPKAAWLVDFALVPAAPKARGGAKFHAVWIEDAVLKGQLWIPTKGDGPLIRVRLTSTLPKAAGGAPDPAAVAGAQQVVLRELAGIASQWVAEHE